MNDRAKERARRMARLRAAQRRKHQMWLSVAATALVVVALVAWYAVSRGSDEPVTPSAAPATVSEDGVGLVVGAGPVTVELYSDFLCPACRAFETDARDEIASLLQQNKIRLIYRPVAILDRLSTNQYSTRSANGAGCAADAGKLIDYADVLFDNQPAEGGAGWTDDELIRLASTAGIGDVGFGQCVRERRYSGWVKQVTESMGPRNVLGTPTVFVNGEQLQGPTGERLVAAVTNGVG